MMKNSYLYMLGVAVMATSLTACKDDDLVKGTPLEEGTEIQFGVAPKADGTRTYYDPTDVSNADSTAWDIFWNYGANNKDHIYVYSPEAASGRNQAEYVVNATEGGQNTTIACVKTGEYGVQAGAKNPHNFYAAYPASNVKQGQCTGTQIKMTMPIRQDAEYAGYTEENSTSVNPGLPSAAIGKRSFKMNPDMSCALMVAENKNVTLEEGKSVDLPFKALATCLNITINGGTTNTTNDPERITSVVIEGYQADGKTPANIAGDFTYDFAGDNGNGTVTYDTSEGSNATNMVIVSTLAHDNEGDEIGIPVVDQNTLNLNAFIAPASDVAVIKVRVFNRHSKYYTKTLTMTNFKHGQISKVVLPKTNPSEATVDYSVWLSQLDPRIYISELSLPGSQFAFSYVIENDASKQTQTKTFREQMVAGSRVLQGFVTLNSGGTPCIATNQGKVVQYNNADLTLDLVISEMVKELEANHGDEFCVLTLSDWVEGAASNPKLLTNLWTAMNTALSKNELNGKIVTDVNASTTIGDVRGKVIVKFQLNGSTGYDVNPGGNGGANTNAMMNTLLTQIQDWKEMDGVNCLFNWFTPACESGLVYAPLVFSQVGSFDKTGEFSYSRRQFYKPTIKTIKNGLSVTAANQLLSTAANDNNNNNWYGNINATSKPSNSELNSNMWLIFTENSRLSVNASLWSYVTSAISSTYNSDSHNKFYMTFLGGTDGSDMSGSTLINSWMNTVKATTFNTIPYGWVLFNMVGDEKNTTVKQGISTVIDHNTTEWKLKRRTETAPGSGTTPSPKAEDGGRMLIVRR